MNKRKFGLCGALVLGLTFLVSSGEASTITIGASVNGGPTGILATSPLGSAAFSGPLAPFFITSASGSADPIIVLPSLFNTNAQIAASSVLGGTLDIYITAQGLLAPTGLNTFFTSLTSNTLQNATASLSAYLDTADGLFQTICGTCTTLASFAFAPPGPDTSVQALSTDAGPNAYSITALYHIVFGAGGNANLTVNVSVPGPILGTGIPGLILACGALIALARRRRRQLA